MQIFEVTAAAAPGLVTSIASGIGKAVAQNVQQAAFGQAVPEKEPGVAGERQLAAMQINQASIQPLAQAMQKSWSEIAQSFLKDVRPPVPSLSQVNPNDLNNRLRPMLDRMVQDLIQRGFDIDTLDQLVVDDPAMTRAAQLIKQNYKNNVDAIWKETLAPSGKNILPQVFLALSRDVVAPAQSMLSFNAKQKATKVATPDKTMSPQAQQMATKLGLDSADIQALQQFAKANPAAFSELAGTKR